MPKSEEEFKEKNQERAKHNRQEKQQQKKMDEIRKSTQKLQPQRIEIEEKITHVEKRNKTSREQLKKLFTTTGGESLGGAIDFTAGRGVALGPRAYHPVLHVMQ